MAAGFCPFSISVADASHGYDTFAVNFFDFVFPLLLSLTLSPFSRFLSLFLSRQPTAWTLL